MNIYHIIRYIDRNCSTTTIESGFAYASHTPWDSDRCQTPTTIESGFANTRYITGYSDRSQIATIKEGSTFNRC